MPLMDDIADAQKTFDLGIKAAEAKKKEIVGLSAEWVRNGSDVSKEVQRVVGALKLAQDMLKDWSEGYDYWIEVLKQNNRDFGEYKKKSVQADKFYNALKDEKEERDKARKKLGAGAKPSKEDQIADAAFKKAEAAYENDPCKGIEKMLKDIDKSMDDAEKNHRNLVADLNKAAKEHDELCKLLRSYADSTALRGFHNRNAVEKNPMGAEFDSYFNKLK